MIGLDSYSRQFFYLFRPHFDLYQSLNRLPIWNSQNCSTFPLAFVAGWLQGHWWGFISRNYVVWPTFLLMNVFIALKGSHFWFLFSNLQPWMWQYQTFTVCLCSLSAQKKRVIDLNYWLIALRFTCYKQLIDQTLPLMKTLGDHFE